MISGAAVSRRRGGGGWAEGVRGSARSPGVAALHVVVVRVARGSGAATPPTCVEGTNDCLGWHVIGWAPTNFQTR